MYDFERFPVYLASEKLYQSLVGVIEDSKISKHFRDQLDRASTSITLNIAEGAGKFSKNDKKNFYIIARGSAHECVAILRLLKLKKKINEETFNDAYSQLELISRMLSGLINKMRSELNK